jgi:hypothetical protein
MYVYVFVWILVFRLVLFCIYIYIILMIYLNDINIRMCNIWYILNYIYMICIYDITLQLYKLCHQNMQCVFYLMTWEVSSWQKHRDLRLVICEVSGDHWKAYVDTYINGIFNRIWPATRAMDRSHYSALQVGTSREFEQRWFKLTGCWIYLEIGRPSLFKTCLERNDMGQDECLHLLYRYRVRSTPMSQVNK